MLKILIGGVNLAAATGMLTSGGVEPFLTFQLTSLVVHEMRGPLCALSVTISFYSTVWCASKVSPIPATFFVVRW